MASHFSILAWEIPWIGEPGGLQSMGLQRVEQDRSDFTHKMFLYWFGIFEMVLTGSSE